MTFTATSVSEQPVQSLYWGHHTRLRTLRVGYVQLNDAAPFILAETLGLFTKYGLTVELHRELGWATARDKLIFGELEATQALAPLPFAATLGLHMPVARECVATMVLNVNGNAITLANHLRDEGVESADDLRAAARRRPTTRRITLGVVSLYSTHHILLRTWLSQLGIDPARDVRIVVVPPAQMVRNLEARNLDGYCVGEPWNGAAVQRKSGWTAATSATIAPDHPEKVLMLRNDFKNNASEECIRLTAALLEACRLCDDPAQRADLVRYLSHRKYLNCPQSWLLRGFGLPLSTNAPQAGLDLATVRFSGPEVNAPTSAHARWIIAGMGQCGQFDGRTVDEDALADGLFATDYFAAAERLTRQRSSPQTQSTRQIIAHL